MWVVTDILVHETVDPGVTMMEAGLKQNPDGVPQDEFWIIDTELAAALTGSGWLKAGPASINPRNAAGTSLLMIVTPDNGAKQPDRAERKSERGLRPQIFDLIPCQPALPDSATFTPLERRRRTTSST